MAEQPSQTVNVTGEDINAAESIFAPRVTMTAPGVNVLPDSGFAQSLTTAHPAYSGYNPISFRGQIITNPDFLNKYTEDMFALAAEDPANQSWVADPAIVEQRKNKFKQNIVSQLARESMTGDDVRGFIIGRQATDDTRQLNQPVKRNDSDLSPYIQRMIGVESGGDDNARASTSSATGAAQFIDGTWLEEIKKHRPDLVEGKSRQEILDLRRNRDVVVDVTKGWTETNRSILQQNGINITPGALYLAHFAGRRDSVRVLNADPQTPIDKVVSPASIRANPGVFRDVKTAGDLVRWSNRKMNGVQLGAPAPVSDDQPAKQPASTRRPTTFEASQIKSIVASNPVVFQGLGLSDEKGNIQYPEQVIAEQIGANPHIERAFLEAQYDMFTGQLAKSNNTFFDSSDPDAMAKAWVVYSQFGPETLTQYVNLNQFYDPKLSFEQQLPQAKNAMLALRTVRKNGQGVFSAIDKWFTENGPADYSGMARSAELQKPIPLDLNGYTNYLYTSKDTVSGIERLVSEMSAVTPQTTMSSWWNSLTGATQQTPKEIADIVERDLREGTLSRESKGFYLDVMRRAEDETSPFGIEDIFNTIIANAKPVRRGDSYSYSFTYENLPDHAKMSVNTIRATDNQYQNMVSKQADGSYIFEPGRFERLNNKFSGWGAIVTEQRQSWNPDGTYAGMKDVPATGIFAQIANMGSAFTFEAGQFAVDYLLAPGLRATGAAAGAFGWEQLQNATEVGVASEWMRDFQDKNLLDQVDGMGVKATVYGTEMALYMASMYATGGLASAGLARSLAASARYLETASAGRKAHQLYDAGRILAAPGSTRLGAMTQKFITGVETNAVWAVPLRFELGGAGLELLGGQEKSIYNGGLVDSALEAITGGEFDTEKAYLVSDRITQFGVDALTGFALGNVFDNLWAASKFGANIATGRGGRALGLGADGYFDAATKPVFGPDWRRFMYNVTDNLQEVPIGSIEDSIKNQFNGRMIGYAADKIETVNDVALNFHQQTGEVYEILMQDITNSIRYYDEKLGRTPMTEDQITARAQAIYNGAFDDLAENMLSVLKGGDNINANRFAWGFVDALDEQSPTVRQVPAEVNGVPMARYDLATAVRVRAEQPGRVIKSVGDNMYTVHEVDMGFWSVDLASRLRKGLVEQSSEEFVERSMRRAGFDPKAPSDESSKLLTELGEIAPHMAGRPFLTRAGGKSSLGYIESYDGNSFYIRDSQTGELRKMLDNEVLDFVARKGPRPVEIAGLLPESGTVRPRGRDVGPSSGQPFEMGGMTEAGARVVPGEEGTAIVGGDKQAYMNSLYTSVRDRVKQVGPEISMGEDGIRRVTNLDGTDLFNVAQLRRMGATEKDIYEATFGDQLQDLDVLKTKLAEVQEKSYASVSYKQKKVNELNAQIQAKQAELADLEAYSDVLISQTNAAVAQEIPKKVRKAKKAAKKAEEIKNDSPAVKETLNPEDCAPGTIKSVPRSSVPTKAEDGLTDTVKGTNWKIVKDFKGMPKHSQGGVDITISDKGVSMRKGGKDIKAAHGLLITATDI